MQVSPLRFLVFRLYAPLSSWGDVAVGEVRPTANYPSQSAVLGLLAAALGLRRDDEDAHLALRDGVGIVIGVLEEGRLLRDYHTAQVPGRSSLKKRPHRTRQDEMAVPKDELNTILSTRDYRESAVSLVAIWEKPGAAYTVGTIQQALLKPTFTLYLGRKSCPAALPLVPTIVEADDGHAAFGSAEFPIEPGVTHKLDGTPLPLRRLVWSDEAVMKNIAVTFSVPRKDRLISRTRWQFGDRMEHVAVLGDTE